MGLSSLRANGPREARPDDRLHEAIHLPAWTEWIASPLSLLAMTVGDRTWISPALSSLIFREAHGGALGVRDVTEHLAIQAIIRLGGGEEAIAAGVTYHDA